MRRAVNERGRCGLMALWMNTAHTRAKLHEAMRDLAQHPGTMRERVRDVCQHSLSVLSAEDFPPHLRDAFTRIWEQATHIKGDGKVGSGSVDATFADMDNETAEHLAHEIVALWEAFPAPDDEGG